MRECVNLKMGGWERNYSGILKMCLCEIKSILLNKLIGKSIQMFVNYSSVVIQKHSNWGN
jgi:hypothetical protein